MITLEELAAWEDRLAREVEAVGAQAGPDLAARDRALEQAGTYAEYASVFGSYVEWLELADAPAAAREALKRATALVWLAGVLPAPATGLAELPEQAVRTVRQRLEAACRRGELDTELEWMLPWYYALDPFALVGPEPLPSLEALVTDADATAWRRLAPAPAAPALAHRGLLGRYWATLPRE
ncbi:MAG TPA: hypothetical protein VFS40_08080 [Gemmatimonadales bacterium]|nr:hypothetical protein [Gemmatimonadales bacterium]